MGMLDLFDEAFDLYKKNFALFVLITGIVYVPTVGISTYLILPAARDMVADAPGDFNGIIAWVGPYVGSIALVAPIYALLAGLLLNALVVAVSSRYLGEPVTIGDAFRKGASVTAQTAIALVLYSVLLVCGYAACVIPGLAFQLLCIPLQFFVHVMVNENKKNMFGAISRSWNIVKTQGSLLSFGHTVHWLLWFVLMIATLGAVQIFAEAAVNSAVPFLPLLGAHKDLADTISIEIAWMILLPFQVCVVTMFYYDLRIRKEGYDMEVLAQILGYPLVALPAQAVTAPVRGKRGQK